MPQRKGAIIAAELVGTFCLVFAGCGAILVSDLTGGTPDHQGIGLAFGLAVMAMIYSVGNISGAHINPAVTIGFHLSGRLRGGMVLPYISSQLAGAVLAALLLRAIFPEAGTLGETIPAAGTLRALCLEAVLTAILMFVILNVSTGHKEKGIMAGVAVGGTVCMAALLGGPISGASMNPARSLGPALVAWRLSDAWIYILGPVLGAAAATPACRLIQGQECCLTGKDQGNDRQAKDSLSLQGQLVSKPDGGGIRP